jgi:hypothetical protein
VPGGNWATLLLGDLFTGTWRISEGAANVDQSELHVTWEEFDYRVDVFRATNGAHILHYQINVMSFRVFFQVVSCSYL